MHSIDKKIILGYTSFMKSLKIKGFVLMCALMFFCIRGAVSIPVHMITVGKTYYICASSSLTMREGPGTQYKKITSLPTKTPITVLKKSDKIEEKLIDITRDVCWLEIDANGQKGWIYSAYIEESPQKVDKLLNLEGTYTGDRRIIEKTIGHYAEEHIKYMPKDVMVHIEYVGNEQYEYVVKLKDEFYVTNDSYLLCGEGGFMYTYETIGFDEKLNKLCYKYNHYWAILEQVDGEDHEEILENYRYTITLRPALNPEKVKNELLNDSRYLEEKQKIK